MCCSTHSVTVGAVWDLAVAEHRAVDVIRADGVVEPLGLELDPLGGFHVRDGEALRLALARAAYASTTPETSRFASRSSPCVARLPRAPTGCTTAPETLRTVPQTPST